MSMPSIEIAWGGGRWNGGHKRAVRPYVQTAVELAQEGTDFLGLDTDIQKTAIVYRVPGSTPVGGGCLDEVNFGLYIRAGNIKRRRVSEVTPKLAVVALHELIHSFRFEKFDTDTILEFAVNEGIAHVGADMFARELLGRDEDGVRLLPDYSGQLGRPPLLYWRLARDAKNERDNPEQAWTIYEKWFCSPKEYVSPGVLAGVIAVQNLVTQGYTMSELIAMPPEQVLGIDI